MCVRQWLWFIMSIVGISIYTIRMSMNMMVFRVVKKSIFFALCINSSADTTDGDDDDDDDGNN